MGRKMSLKMKIAFGVLILGIAISIFLKIKGVF